MELNCCAPISAQDDLSPTEKWFQNEDSKITNVAIGVFFGYVCYVLTATTLYALKSKCSWFTLSQEAIKIFSLFKRINPILDLAWKGLWRVYLVVIAPVMEEMVFRGMLNDSIEQSQGKEQTFLKRIVRIAIVSIAFGLCHISPLQDMVSNVTLLCITSGLGVVFHVLKEQRKGLTAPIAASMMFSLASTL